MRDSSPPPQKGYFFIHFTPVLYYLNTSINKHRVQARSLKTGKDKSICR
jgi:hypothetical protein